MVVSNVASAGADKNCTTGGNLFLEKFNCYVFVTFVTHKNYILIIILTYLLSEMSNRQAISDPEMLWPNDRLPYVIQMPSKLFDYLFYKP